MVRQPGRSPCVSVILCTYNPRADLLAWSVESLRTQTLPQEAFEFVLVDNNSDPPVDLPLPFGRIIREPGPGLVHARVSGIRATQAPLIVFLDDDNHLEPDYLERALRIAEDNPSIGCFGGVAFPILESPIPGWKHALLPYLGVRDYGGVPITSTRDEWGKWEPIGAGMVCRRDVAERFVYWTGRLDFARRLGRAGTGFMSGEDTLIAQAAYRLGYSCSYQPDLVLSHYMKVARLSARSLARTMEGHGRSFALLQSLRGIAVTEPRWWDLLLAAWRFLWTAVDHGLRAASVKAFWDAGYIAERRRMGV
jgi:glycosyltransferase involved in cell wall biosynthesis